jgi:transposase-like protein
LPAELPSVEEQLKQLELEVVVPVCRKKTTTTIKLPAELPSVEEALKDLVEAKTPLSVIAKKLGVSEESACAKIRRLGFVFWEVGWLGN